MLQITEFVQEPEHQKSRILTYKSFENQKYFWKVKSLL